MNTTTKFLCPVCQSGHATEYAAEDCCPREAKEVLFCGECNTWFDGYDKGRAEECCKKKIAHRMFLAELERAKRFCLCGEAIAPEDVHDAQIVGTLPRCRSCILKVAPELLTADAIVSGRAA